MKYLQKILALVFAFTISIANALPAMPSTGSCAFLITQPVPLGITNFPFKGTGYNFLGTLNFNNASSGVLNLVVVNVTYNNQDGPQYEHSAVINNAPFTITPMTSSNGFSGGFVLKAIQSSTTTAFKTTTPITPVSNIEIYANVVPVNDGKSILMQLTATKAGSGIGPGSGVCQF
jgi:hypothetical protein